MSVGLYSYVTEGAPKRFPEETRDLISSYSYARDLTRSCSIRDEDYKKVTFDYLENKCAFGDLSQKRAQLLLMGDSHADHFKPFVEQLSKSAKLKGVFHVQGSCSPIELPKQGLPIEQATVCERRNADLLQFAGDFQYVVLASFWNSESEEASFESKLRTVVEKIIQAGAVPVIFKDNPSYEPDLSQCVLHKQRGWVPPEKNCNIPYNYVKKTQGTVDKVIDEIKLAYPKTLLVDPKKIMCDSKECITYIENTALYKDSNHINTKAASLLGEQYISRLGNPLSAPEPIYAEKVPVVPDTPTKSVTGVSLKHAEPKKNVTIKQNLRPVSSTNGD
jgi:hypothetical protein